MIDKKLEKISTEDLIQLSEKLKHEIKKQELIILKLKAEIEELSS